MPSSLARRSLAARLACLPGVEKIDGSYRNSSEAGWVGHGFYVYDFLLSLESHRWNWLSFHKRFNEGTATTAFTNQPLPSFLHQLFSSLFLLSIVPYESEE